MEGIDRLARALRPQYARFLAHREGEILLTGHSHQAWPDVGREGQLEAWDDAARSVDGKWGRVFGEILPELQGQLATRLGTLRGADLALAPNTHELVYRLLSCFPAEAKVLTTDSEFHSLDRQLRRSEEAGLQVRRVSVEGPEAPFVDRFLRELELFQPHLVALSQVFFTNARVVEPLLEILSRAEERGVPVLVDTYHSFCALELNADAWPGCVFATGGGYKYAQLGEGVCFLLLPADATSFRPRHTGWMADFAGLAGPRGPIRYGEGGYRFFGATFDPTPWYRAVHVLRWMDRQGLDPAALREASLLRTGRLIQGFDELGLAKRGLALVTPRADAARGAFVAFRHSEASALQAALRERGVHTDARHDLLRLGPAPYTTSGELDAALRTVSELL
ncbi:MAG: hypothetical protein AAFZ18_39065 [Myxococcota bacterium]